jgi:hypothetical protein
MLEESADDGNNGEAASIPIAADLLRRMFMELESLEVGNARLHFAMCKSGHVIRQRLDLLSGTAEVLKASPGSLRAPELSQRAKRLIFELAGELEQLALEAEHEFEWMSSSRAGVVF